MTVIERLRQISDGKALSASDVFDAIFEAGSALNDGDRAAVQSLEIAIRLLEGKRLKLIPPNCVEAIDYLAEECGLYPYIEPDAFNLLTRTLVQAHTLELGKEVRLHAKQMQVLLWLLNGDNVVLSAPTSFGKTLLVDAFIANKKPRSVIMIMPTIALIDEARKRIKNVFGDDYDVITTVDRPIRDKPTIFILTQERLLARPPITEVDFLFVDEFYKLDPSRDDGRYQQLNLALYRYLPRSKQCFMAGPHIRGINLGTSYAGNFRFVQTNYKTVSVNILDRTEHSDRLEVFVSDLNNVGDDSSLVFVSSPGKAEELLDDLLEREISYTTAFGSSLQNWIAENYHRDWRIASGAAAGVAVHHGRLPRSLGQLFIQLFNSGELTVLICTSTLIEGVNTSAANVFIYDKKINSTDLDFFSFANIRGRVGRMMRHFVGNAYLYHEPPEEIDTEVDVPVLSDPGSSSAYILANVVDADLNDAGRSRREQLPNIMGVPAYIIRDHGGIGSDNVIFARNAVEESLKRDQTELCWSGFPDHKYQSDALAEICVQLSRRQKQRTGLFTGKQIAWGWGMLRKCQTLPKFLSWFAWQFEKDDRHKGVDRAFQFLQACEFSFPRSASLVEALVNHMNPEIGASYGPFLVGMENWFRPPWMKQLDEQGIPLPLAERLRPLVGEADNLLSAIEKLQSLDIQSLDFISDLDKFILRSAAL